MSRAFAIVALLLSALVAGCNEDPSQPTAGEEPDAFDDVETTATTGAIKGIVVSEAIVPIEGVLVKLVDGTNRTTDAEGAFVFNGLTEGDYFVSASKVGYLTAQQSATVVAGVEPATTKIQLVADVAAQPYAELVQWTGFLGCGFGTNGGGLRNTGVNPCAVDATLCQIAEVCLLNTANTHVFEFGGPHVPDFASGEMVWDGTQALGEGLNLGWFDEGVADFKSTTGESPLVLPTNRTEIVAAHSEDINELMMRVFPGTGAPLTLTLQQRFDIYATYFYGFVPREGWSFTADGQCVTPDDCGA